LNIDTKQLKGLKMIYTNMYINKICEVAKNESKTKEYIDIMIRANERAINKKVAKQKLGYFEMHHIVPRSFSMGGEKDILNYAYLTAAEHYTAHKLLTEMELPDNLHAKMAYAFWLMVCCNYYEVSAEDYEAMRKLNSELNPSKDPSTRIKASQTYFDNTGFNHPMHNPEIVEQIKQTNLEKYGYDNPLKSPELVKQRQETYFEKTGYYNPGQNPEVVDKIKQTNLERYGYENRHQDPQYQEQWKQNYKQKTGYDNPSQDPLVKNKKVETYFNKTGYKYPYQNPAVREQMRLNNLERYGYEYPQQDPEVQKQRKLHRLQQYDRSVVIEIQKIMKDYKLPFNLINIKGNWKTASDEKLFAALELLKDHIQKLDTVS